MWEIITFCGIGGGFSLLGTGAYCLTAWAIGVQYERRRPRKRRR